VLQRTALPLLTALALLATPAPAATVQVYSKQPLRALVVARGALFGQAASGEVLRLEEGRHGLKTRAVPTGGRAQAIAGGPQGLLLVRSDGAVDRLGSEGPARVFGAGAAPVELLATPEVAVVRRANGSAELAGGPRPGPLVGAPVQDLDLAGANLWILRADGALEVLDLASGTLEPYVQYPRRKLTAADNLPCTGGVPGGVQLVGNAASEPHEREVHVLDSSGRVFEGLAVGVPVAGGDPIEDFGREVEAPPRVARLRGYLGAVLALDESGRLHRRAPGATLRGEGWRAIPLEMPVAQLVNAGKAVYVLDPQGRVWRDHVLPQDPVAREEAIREKYREFYEGT